MEIISRQVAKSKGLTTFFTGKPCKYGHFSNRYVSSGACTECLTSSSSPNSTNVDSIIEDTQRRMAAVQAMVDQIKAQSAIRIEEALQRQKRAQELEAEREARNLAAAEQEAIKKRNAMAVRDLKAVMVPLHEFVELTDLKWARDTVRAAVHSRLPEGVEMPDSMLWSSKPPRGGLVYTFYVPADMYDEVKRTLMAKRADRPWQQCYFSVHPSRENAVASILYSFAFARDPAAKMQDVKVQHIAGFTVVATVHRDDVEAIRALLASPTSQAAHSWLDGDIDK